MARLRRLTRNPELVRQLKTDFRQADLSPADRTMCEDVEKLTLKPWELEEADVVALREAGFSDSAILEFNQVTSYYAYVNRLADGLGVELEEFWKELPQEKE